MNGNLIMGTITLKVPQNIRLEYSAEAGLQLAPQRLVKKILDLLKKN
ncbi:MAG: hypothetical protein ABFS56_13210 [Pseudomonadota bacterium]